MSSIKALLFDLGGVLLEVHFDKVFTHWEKFSLLNAKEMKSRFKMDEPYQRHEKGTLPPSEFFEHIRNTLQVNASDADIAAGWNALFGLEITETLDAIDAVRSNVRVFGFSNTNRTHQLYWEEHFPRMQNTCEKLFVSSEIGYRKPDAEAFQYILDEISVQPEELLFFDDSPENIEGAEQMGIQSVLVTDPASVKQALNKHVV